MTKLIAEYETAFNRQMSQWQAEHNQLNIELVQLRSNAKQLQQQKALYIIKSPIMGNIQQVPGKYEGSYVQIGEVLGIISPDSSLLVECYVSTFDIGLLKPKMKTNFQIDAFNYNEWGLVSGSLNFSILSIKLKKVPLSNVSKHSLHSFCYLCRRSIFAQKR
jgi:HlyD family secretion protein